MSPPAVTESLSACEDHVCETCVKVPSGLFYCNTTSERLCPDGLCKQYSVWRGVSTLCVSQADFPSRSTQTSSFHSVSGWSSVHWAVFTHWPLSLFSVCSSDLIVFSLFDRFVLAFYLVWHRSRVNSEQWAWTNSESRSETSSTDNVGETCCCMINTALAQSREQRSISLVLYSTTVSGDVSPQGRISFNNEIRAQTRKGPSDRVLSV